MANLNDIILHFHITHTGRVIFAYKFGDTRLDFYYLLI